MTYDQDIQVTNESDSAGGHSYGGRKIHSLKHWGLCQEESRHEKAHVQRMTHPQGHHRYHTFRIAGALAERTKHGLATHDQRSWLKLFTTRTSQLAVQNEQVNDHNRPFDQCDHELSTLVPQGHHRYHTFRIAGALAERTKHGLATHDQRSWLKLFTTRTSQLAVQNEQVNDHNRPFGHPIFCTEALSVLS
ncbi:hypothetical protein CSKR_110002 [Clonorchis sinensis]|uniref:Uncharacterized protein n=1 Tax=Clonorchis sinensis TaxID=79923 RepID=A0A3R7D892_CLOSI|nr:hypothetical protein CSKR_110002 [Clonorchis sinensis]